MPVDWDITVNGTRLTLEQAETLRHALRMIREPFRIHARKEEYERLCEVLDLLALKP
jgi:hexokinase